MKKRYNTIDFFKIIFCLSVVFGHTYCIFFQQLYKESFGFEMTQIHNVATDGFFICAGIFMAKGIEKARKNLNSSKEIYIYTVKKRISGLWGGYMFAGVLALVYMIFFDTDLFKDSIDGLWTYPFFISCINGIPGLGSTWYISALFWCGLIIAAMLIYTPELSKHLMLPILIFLTYSFMYSLYSCNNLGNRPMVVGFISAGLIRALCVISIGVELYYLAILLQKNINESYLLAHKWIIALIELLAFALLMYSMLYPGLSKRSFLIYPSFGALCIIFLNHWEVLFGFTNSKAFGGLIQRTVKYTYMIYLTHSTLIRFMCNVVNLDLRMRYCYPAMMILSVCFGIICYWVELYIRKKAFKVAIKTASTKG